jgi:hypothetical protein
MNSLQCVCLVVSISQRMVFHLSDFISRFFSLFLDSLGFLVQIFLSVIEDYWPANVGNNNELRKIKITKKY